MDLRLRQNGRLRPEAFHQRTHERPDGRRGDQLRLFRIESERLKLSAPFGRRIAEPLDADAAGQATFYGCFDKIGGEEG